MSKVIANQLKKILSAIISKSQSAIIPSRTITDNVIVAYKGLHSMKTKHKGREGCMVIKLDISKAYMTEWNGNFWMKL